MERVHQVYFPKSGFEPDSYGPLLMLEHPIFHNKLRIFYQDFQAIICARTYFVLLYQFSEYID